MLEIGGYLNLIIGIGHLIGLFWSKSLFEYTGIDKEMNRLSKIHFSFPYLLTIIVGIVFLIFGFYGLSGADKFRLLPFLKIGIFTISGIYLLRGLGGIIGTITKKHKKVSPKKEIIFSSIALIIGILYLNGGFDL